MGLDIEMAGKQKIQYISQDNHVRLTVQRSRVDIILAAVGSWSR